MLWDKISRYTIGCTRTNYEQHRTQSGKAVQSNTLNPPRRQSPARRTFWCVVAGVAVFGGLMYIVLILIMLKLPPGPNAHSSYHAAQVGRSSNTRRSQTAGMHGFLPGLVDQVHSEVGAGSQDRIVVFEGTFEQGNRQGPCFPQGKQFQYRAVPKRISVVGVVRDRTTTLLQALQSWLDCSSVDEVVLVDWGSTPSLPDQLGLEGMDLLKDSRIRFIRAEGETEWSIVRAYNLGFQFASGSLILKADADTMLKEDFFRQHTFESDQTTYFYRGNWRHSPNENNKHLNGILYAQKQHIFKVMGYDERMKNYGHDDADLFLRLGTSLKLEERRLNYSTIWHIYHSEEQRKAGYGNLKWVDHSRNIRGANETFAPWHLSELHPSTYDLRWESQDGLWMCNSQAVYIPPGFLQMLSPSSAESFDLLSHHWALRIYCKKKIPWEVITKLKHKPSMRALMAIYRDILDSTWRGSYLIVIVRYGIAERLRAYCSAKAYAQKIGATLVTLWAPDEFSKARFSDLMILNPDELVIEEWHESFFPKKMKQFKHISYVKNRFKDKGSLVKVKPGKATVVESAHMLATDPVIDLHAVEQCYHQLQPSSKVQSIMKEYSAETVGKVGMYLPLYPGYPRYIQGGHAKPTLEDKDVVCNLKDFSHSLQKIWQTLNSTDNLFMSCDTFHVCLHAQKTIPVLSDWIYERRRQCNGLNVISVECEQVLFADAIILAQLEVVFAPENSVFLDMVHKMSLNHTIIRSPCSPTKVLLQAGIKEHSASKCTTTVCKFVGDMLDELESVL